MNQDPDIKELIRLLEREHAITRLTFGVSIIVLSLVLMFIAPVVIRSDAWSLFSTGGNHGGYTSDNTSMGSQQMHEMSSSTQVMATTTATTTKTTTSTTTKP